MQRKPIRRAGLLSAGYDPSKRYLEIEFDTHRVLRYCDVDSETAHRFLTASQPGSFFHDVIEEEYTSYEPGPEKANADAKPKKGVPDALKALFGS